MHRPISPPSSLPHLPPPDCAADLDGDTPLHNAARGNHAAVVSLLLSRGADPAALNTEGRTPAAEAEEREVVELLVRAAAAVKGGGASGATGDGAVTAEAKNASGV